MLWVTAPDGRLAFISHGWCEHTGQSEAEALGEDGFGWLEAVHAEDRDEVWRVLSAANDRQEPFSLDYRLRHRGGESEYRWAIVAGRPRVGEGGEFLGFVGSVIDVHERKQSEQALREAARRKDEFLATLSHELRGPLAPLRNTIEIMKRAGDDRDVIDGARSTIDRQVTQLVRLVDDLLDVSRITRNKLELRREPVELGPIVELAIESCRPLLEELEHDLEVILPSELLTLHADPARVTQILSNLLHNACKYTGWGSDEDRRKTREAGFDHHLVKPLDYDVLIRVIAGRCDSETPVGT